MGLKVLHGNVIEAQADALIITIDGAKKGMEGNIARAFARKWPDIWSDIEEEIPYPLPLGEVFDYEPASGCPFRLILIASTLNHKDTLTESAKKGIVRTALHNAMTLSADYGIKSIVSAIMTGGWRLSQQSAFLAMTEGFEMALQACRDTALEIYILDQSQYDAISTMSRGMGYR